MDLCIHGQRSGEEMLMVNSINDLDSTTVCSGYCSTIESQWQGISLRRHPQLSISILFPRRTHEGKSYIITLKFRNY